MKRLLLIQNLKKIGAFWSYQSETLAQIPNQILIEEALRWGDVAELKLLFGLFDLPQIRQIWQEKLLPDVRIYPHNYYLALIFFRIKNPKPYILRFQKKYNRYECLKKSIA